MEEHIEHPHSFRRMKIFPPIPLDATHGLHKNKDMKTIEPGA